MTNWQPRHRKNGTQYTERRQAKQKHNETKTQHIKRKGWATKTLKNEEWKPVIAEDKQF